MADGKLKYGLVLAVCQMKSLCFPCLEYTVTGSEKTQENTLAAPQICISTCQYNSALPACCSTCQAEIIKQSCRKCRLSAVSEGISALTVSLMGLLPSEVQANLQSCLNR